jgi:hypothetical protein
VLEVIPDKLALIWADSRRAKVFTANPCEPVELLMGISGLSETQLTDVVKFCVLPSVKAPVAVNCWVNILEEREMVTEAGVMIMDNSSAGVTVNVALLDVIPEMLAVIVVVPSV